jgi:pimeloyl-ACP methyl ester carboxylesterase
MRRADLVLDGERLEAGWWGPPPDFAPTLVLLHEGLGCVGLWRNVPELLAEMTGCGVFAYSRFGYGQSDPKPLPWPMSYMHDEALQVLPRVLDAASVRRLFLVGHSDGGSIAAIHAGGAQDSRVLGLVLIAAHFFVEEMNLASIRAAAEAYRTGDLRRRLSRWHRDVDMAFHGWNGAWLDPRFREFNITDYVSRIRVPVLALQGADDPYGTPAQLEAVKRFARCSVQTQLILHAKHAPHLEAKDAVLPLIADFVAARLKEAAA